MIARRVLLAGVCLVLACSVLWAEDVVLVRDGKPAATIVISGRPLWAAVKPDHELAKSGRIFNKVYAEELQFWIERATGATLPMVTEDNVPAEGTLIVFGESAVSKKLGFDCRTMPPEGFRIVAFDRGVALLGDVFPAMKRGGYFCNRHDTELPDPVPTEADHIDRGIGHATFEFLERFVGYRFYHGADRADEKSIAFGTITPKLTTLAVPAGTDLKKHPDFLHRSGVMSGRTVDDPMAWYRCFRGGASADIHANHTHTSWHRVYGKSNPEIFALDKDGVPYYQKASVRPPFRSALNYAHPKTLELELKHIEHYDRTGKLHNGWRAYATPNRLLPTPADGKWYDHSKEAAPLSFPDGDMYKSQSDVYWQYIARLAEMAKTRWPERMVVGSAYNRRMCAPTDRVRLPDNVAAQIALCRSSAMTTQPIYREWLNNEIDRWHEALGRDRTRLGTWDYFCWPHGFFMAPVVHPHRLQGFLKRNRDKIAGQFVNPGGHPRLDHMMAVVWHKLLWDVDLDVDALLAEHCKLFYGPAGEAIEELYKLTAERYQTTQWATHLGASSIPGRAFLEQIYPPDVVARMKNLFDKAFAAAKADKDPIYLERLHYIYDAPDTEAFFAQDGWEAFFRTAELYHADRPSVAAARYADKPDWGGADTSTLFKGTHVCTAKAVTGDDATQVRFATDGRVLRMQVRVGAGKELAEAIHADGIVLKLYEVPAGKKRPDADIDPHEYFMAPDGGETSEKVLAVTVDRSGATNFKDVTAEVRREGGSWTAEVSIPYAFLGIAREKPRTVIFDVRRMVTLKEFLPQGRRGQAWDGLPEDPRKRKTVEYALALKEGFVWQAFNHKRRGARLRLK